MNEEGRLASVHSELETIQNSLSKKSEEITDELAIWQKVKFGIAQVIGIFGAVGVSRLPEYIRYPGIAIFCAIPGIASLVFFDNQKTLREQRVTVDGLLNDTNTLLERVDHDTIYQVPAQQILKTYAAVETTMLLERCQRSLTE